VALGYGWLWQTDSTVDGPARRVVRDGKEAAEFLWQVPDDQKTRHKIPGMLAEIQELAQKQRAQGGTPGPGRRGEACCVTGGRLGAKRTAAWSFATTGRQFCFR
jgi:hypothetical protein